jgi:acetolactate synthase-1/2/3 large subunit
VIDAKITRWALPHYSTSPKGVVHGIWEMLEERLRAPSAHATNDEGET